MKWAAVGGIALWWVAAGCHADGLGGALGLASDDVLRGLTESEHQWSWQADLHYARSGWYGGVTGFGVRRGLHESAGLGLTVYAGYDAQLTEDWRAGLALRHYDYPGYSRRNNYDYDEAALTLNWRERLLASVIASPDVYVADYYGHYGRGGAFTYELGARQPLPWWQVSVNAGLGYYDLQRQIGSGYVYWNAGIVKQWRSLQLDLRYIGTSDQAEAHFRDLAENRLVFSALWLF